MSYIGADLLSFCVHFLNILKIRDNMWRRRWSRVDERCGRPGRRVQEAAERAASEYFKLKRKLISSLANFNASQMKGIQQVMAVY